MSGITPLLDTLLHQVLGWQRDAPVARRLPGRLIMPPRAGQPPAAAHSDSRLDPRAPATPPRGAAAGATRAATTASGPPTDAGRTGAAAVTRFTAAARAIGDILARFPDGAAVIRAQAPLLSARERGDARALTEALRGNIESSGLFYEAHLARWRNGTYPLARLAQEPQMSQSGSSPARGRLPAPIAAGNALYGVDGQLAADRGTRSGDRPVRAGLEGLVRQQLELLGAPVLRWEGDAWAGLFAAIALHPPPARPDDAACQDRRKPADDDAAPGWRSTLELRVRGLGNVTIDIQFGARTATLDVRAPPVAVERMQAGGPRLRRRLGAVGYRRVVLRIRPHVAAGGAGHG